MKKKTICGFLKSSGGQCQNPKGFMTNHPGRGGCKFHDTKYSKPAPARPKISNTPTGVLDLQESKEQTIIRLIEKKFQKRYKGWKIPCLQLLTDDIVTYLTDYDYDITIEAINWLDLNNEDHPNILRMRGIDLERLYNFYIDRAKNNNTKK